MSTEPFRGSCGCGFTWTTTLSGEPVVQHAERRQRAPDLWWWSTDDGELLRGARNRVVIRCPVCRAWTFLARVRDGPERRRRSA